MADGQIGTLLALLDEAFEDDAEHSLLGNMRHVDDAIWDQAPPGGSRPISELFLHAATASYAYDDAAFRGQPGRWDHWEQDAPRERLAALEWAREGHRRLRESVAALDDSDLDGERDTHWGGRREARRIIFVAAKHNLYHAGEINHARALIQDTDRWPGGVESRFARGWVLKGTSPPAQR